MKQLDTRNTRYFSTNFPNRKKKEKFKHEMLIYIEKFLPIRIEIRRDLNSFPISTTTADSFGRRKR